MIPRASKALPIGALAALVASTLLSAPGPGEKRGTEASSYDAGLRLMDPANPKADLPKACAMLLEAARLAVTSADAASALDAAGRCEDLLSGSGGSIVTDERILATYPRAPAGPAARLRLARSAATTGDDPLAELLLAPLLEESASDAAGISPRQSAKALQALILRASLDGESSQGTRLLDDEFTGVPSSADVRAIAAGGPDGEVWFLDAESGHALSESGTRVAPPGAGEERRPIGLTVDSRGGIYLWDAHGITVPDGERFVPTVPSTEKGAAPEALRKIRGVAVGRMGEIFVLDGSGARLLHYGRDRTFKGEVASFEGKPAALALSQDGTLYVLLPSRGEIASVGSQPTGAPRGERGGRHVRILPLAGEGWEIKDAVAVSIDSLGRLYVLDAGAESLSILDREGRRVALIAPDRDSPEALRSPTAIGVDGAGRIYVAVERGRRVLRFV